MNINIDITEKQAEFLKQFAANQYEGSKDNLATNKPLHLVQTETISYMHDGGGNGSFDVDQYIGSDACLHPNNKDECFKFENEMDLVFAYGSYDIPDEVLSYNEAYDASDVNGVVITDMRSYFEAYGINPDDVEILSAVKSYRTVAYFFILENAREYIKYQAHNLNNPRTYTVDMGYDNRGEYESFFDLLMTIGQSLIENSQEK